MDIRQLRYFVKVVELSNITAAAEALHIAQPSLSQHMLNLESELEVRLLERNAHGTRPTETGKLLYRHAKLILRQLDDARSAIRQESVAPSGRVAIGFPTSTSRVVAAPLLARMRAQYPLVELELVEGSSGDLVVQVAQGRLDLAVTMNARAAPQLEIRPLLEEELFVVVAPAAQVQGPISVAQLAALPLLLPTHPNSVRVATEHLFAAQRHSFKLVAETSAVEILILSVENGLGSTILPSSAFSLAQQQGRVQGIPIEGRPLIRELSLSLSRSAMHSPAVQCVQNTLVKVIGDEVLQGRWQGVRLLEEIKLPASP